MRGKVKFVERNEVFIGNQEDQHRSDIHDVRFTNTYAVLYNGDYVNIDEDEIRNHYDRIRINDDLISQLSDDLHNCAINYSPDDDDEYWLDDSLDDLI